MSYCRFSTNDFQCDLYCYAHVHGGYATHVAQNRLVFVDPLPPPIQLSESEIGAYMERHRKVMAMVERAPREIISLPHAGETFMDATAEDWLHRLQLLRMLGYIFPDDVIEAAHEEIAEERNQELIAQGWTPKCNGMPADETPVDLLCNDGKVRLGYACTAGSVSGFMVDALGDFIDGTHNYEVTHWRKHQ